MDLETFPIVNQRQRPAAPHSVIEKGMLFLLLFTPLAVGAVQPWSTAVMEIASFVVFGAWLLTLRQGNEKSVILPMFLVALVGLVLVVLLQLVPLPGTVLAAVSPATARLYQRFSLSGEASWRTISIHPDATEEELFKLIAYAAVFIVIINHYRTREQVRGLVRAIVMTGCLLAVFAVIQKLTWNGSLFWFYPVRETLHPVGPYINRNHFAGYMEMAIPLGLGLILDGATRIDSRGRLPPVKRISAILGSREFSSVVFLSLAVLFMAGALFMSLSRGGILGFGVAAFVFALLTRSKRSLRKRILALAFVGLAVLVLVVMTGWGRIERRFEELGDEANFKRIEIWRDCAGIVWDFPVWGTGLGTFDDAYLRYQSASPGLLFDHAHNDYLELVTDAGLAGTLLAAGALALFGQALAKAWKARHGRFVTSIAAGGISSGAALAVHSMTDFNLHIPANALLATVIAGITFSSLFNIASGATRRRHGHG
jgi:O-antigen ligase